MNEKVGSVPFCKSVKYSVVGTIWLGLVFDTLKPGDIQSPGNRDRRNVIVLPTDSGSGQAVKDGERRLRNRSEIDVAIRTRAHNIHAVHRSAGTHRGELAVADGILGRQLVVVGQVRPVVVSHRARSIRVVRPKRQGFIKPVILPPAYCVMLAPQAGVIASVHAVW